MARANIIEEIREEIERRDLIKYDRTPGPSLPQIAETPDKIGENLRIHRARIRSPAVLSILQRLTCEPGDTYELERESCVFFYPFYILGAYHEGIREELKRLEGETVDASSQRDSDALLPSPLDQLRCFVQFVETSILPIHRAFREIGPQTPKRVSYYEVPLLFNPGDLIYVPSSEMSTKLRHHQSAVQTVFRCATRISGQYPYSFDALQFPERDLNPHEIDMFCLDHDGEQYALCWRTIDLHYFYGERDITSLPCYPLKLHPNYQDILSQQARQGKKFKALVDDHNKYHYYSGWTAATGIFASPPSPERDDSDDKNEYVALSAQEETEYIDSEVLLDTKEASRHVREWTSLGNRITRGSLDLSEDNIDCRLWSSYSPKSVFLYNMDTLVSYEACAYWPAREQYMTQDGSVLNGYTFVRKDWTAEDLALLPRRIYGYVVRERRFARLYIESFQARTLKNNATLDDIQMTEGHRLIIRSTISSHFSKANKGLVQANCTYTPDIIRGKGRGLVILLHGAPGVGKTATAEAVALEFEKPLFPITCGDLGTTPAAVEKSLKEIFRYAHLWNCILLLDEADVFLTQRDRTDVERNALVSVFLRVLEYYSGILFLTTNRVGALDEAFRSRVHISLYYPHLSREYTLKILRGNLARLPREDKLPAGVTPGPNHLEVMDDHIEEFVLEQYDKHYKVRQRGPWNGRQIRNSVQIAMCLALFENDKKGRNRPAILTADHFRKVHETIAEFDEYLNAARLADDHKLAHMEGVRYDTFGVSRDFQVSTVSQYRSWDDVDNPPVNQRGRQWAVASNETPSRHPFTGRVDASSTPASKSGGLYPAERSSPFHDPLQQNDPYSHNPEEMARSAARSPMPRQRLPPNSGSHLTGSDALVDLQYQQQRKTDDLTDVYGNAGPRYLDADPRANPSSLGTAYDGIWNQERGYGASSSAGGIEGFGAGTPVRQR
ncbi:hypothetical protein BJX61DRAFT_521409 [Aspergillus egyptiacus]|nr:hypothetical protein BJX61DRAFT_521409 [Aspergillus egyptiacus]